MRVCIVAEGCYPFVVGGVSSWVHSLIQLFPETEFVILAIAANRSQRENMPMNCRKMCLRSMNFILTMWTGAAARNCTENG